LSRFDGRAAIVTGAAQGTGYAIASKLMSEGANVLMIDSDGPTLEEAAGTLGAPFVRADVSSRPEMHQAVREAVRRFGRLDVAVAHAGIGSVAPFLEIDDELWERVMRVNVTGAFISIQEAALVMAGQGGGSIVATGSTNGFWVERNTSHYSATKAAVMALVRGAAFDLGRLHIRVNAVAPSVIRTASAAFITEDPDFRDTYLERVPLGRFAETEDIADVVCFLASDEARYITGQYIVVDGGVTLGIDVPIPKQPLPGERLAE
jgi:NAD(P)-dependent dehydrogenase (short-subunit alcohol dehydrogenase family)